MKHKISLIRILIPLVFMIVLLVLPSFGGNKPVMASPLPQVTVTPIDPAIVEEMQEQLQILGNRTDEMQQQIQILGNQINSLNTIIIIVVALLLIATIIIVHLYNQYKNTKKALLSLESINKSISARLNDLANTTNNLERFSDELVSRDINIKETEEIDSKSLKIDNDLNLLIQAYEKVRHGLSYAPVTEIVQALKSMKKVGSKEEALLLIDKLSRKYPQGIRMGRVREKEGTQLTIFLDRI